MDVKRYDATVEYGPGWDSGASAVMDEAADGDWVEFTDYAAVEAECDLRATIIREIREALGAPSSVLDTDLAGGVRGLRAERDAATREAEICKAIIKHCGGSFVVKCMLCDAPYDVRDPDWLKHDLTCPKHPMRDVERERDALRRVLDIIKDYCDSDVLAYAGHSVDELVTQEVHDA